MTLFSALPSAQGLYNPADEHDACGVAMVATLKKEPTHAIVSQALTALRNMEHRGASGAEPDSGDGAGILICIPDEFYRSVVEFTLPESGSYATGIAFIAKEFDDLPGIVNIAQEENITILGWRELPTNDSALGTTALSVMPRFVQLFIAGKNGESNLELDRLAFCFRKRVEHTLPIYFPSLSSRTVVYMECSRLGNWKNSFPISPMNW